jgi:transketolase
MTNSETAYPKDLDTLCINTIRTLAMDAVQKANSGHPGAPMGLAPAAYVLWTRFLKHNPQNPDWLNRDRFVLSAGHASMLLYSLLYLTGYDLSLDDIKNFRQWKSKTPGHPEHGCVPGVETTTGPLGQGFANAVGMALAEQHLSACYNRPAHSIIDHYTYMICSDGDTMEGIASEAASLAGHLGLSKIICLYDDNKISIEGSTDIAFTEDVGLRFKAYNWHVQKIENGNDPDAISQAIEAAQEEKAKPSIIMIRTNIAYGSPNKQDSAGAHGAPLGDEEVRLTKHNPGWPADEKFLVPDSALSKFRECVDNGSADESQWQRGLEAYRNTFPDLAESLMNAVNGILPEGWDTDIPDFSETSAIATRSASGKVLNAIAGKLPALIGGSADLAPSNNTLITTSHDFQKNSYDGRNIRFGVREHAMGGILSGMALHKGLRPYGGTFLTFADYMRPSIRLAGLMGLPVIYVFTHDSIAVGEDGPTHQPIEHLATLRAIEGLTVIRPADAAETAEAWRMALNTMDGPVALILSRQNLPVIDRKRYSAADGLAKGAYVISKSTGMPDIVLVATGSEVHIVLEAKERLSQKKISVSVVSMPSWELFEKMPKEYQDQVLPPAVTHRLAVEAGHPMGWERFCHTVCGIKRYGASAPGNVLMEKFGFTVENIVAKAQELLKK